MTELNQIWKKIALLSTGETWTISAQDLLISRADFYSISTYLSQEAVNGKFTIEIPKQNNAWFNQTSFTITKS